ncbi:MAG: riboflavin synthase [Gemmatimonadota bacterium]
MFTGLITEIGEVSKAQQDADGLELSINSRWPDLTDGESIAVDGACLTVTRRDTNGFRVHVIRSSLDRTCFAEYRKGRKVNLERALRIGDRLGGHMVAGHVDGVGQVSQVSTREDARLVDIAAPPEVIGVSIPLGSVTVDGVSLTINALPGPGLLQVSLIPHTLAHSTLRDRKAGDRVHLEADMVGKYVKQLMSLPRAP